jgi:uncharacterized protein YlxP (DUF503 family)
MAQPDRAHVAVLTFELLIPAADSLKSKRRVVKSLKDRIRARFNVSVAEIGFLEEWQRSAIGVALIGNDRRVLDSTLSAIGRLVEEEGDIRLLDSTVEWL